MDATVALSQDYQVLADAGVALTVLSVVLVGVGEFLRHDGFRAHRTVGLAAEGAGWIALFAGLVVRSQQTAEDQLDCTVYGRRCPDPDQSIVLALLQSLFPDPGQTLVEAGCVLAAAAVGWALAKATRRQVPPSA